MTHPLGQWAVIDIETTGINPESDSIIDIGFYQFEGTKLVKTFSSLVSLPIASEEDESLRPKLSYFIQKLTGITDRMLQGAPNWQEIADRLLELEGHHLIAHNASFESQFLEKWIKDAQFQDSLVYLGLLFPERSGLSLESLLVDWGISEKEEHRGLSDSLDLLKVLLIAQWDLLQHEDKHLTWNILFKKHGLIQEWWCQFSTLTKDEVLELAGQIDFPLISFYQKWLESKAASSSFEIKSRDISLEFSGKNVQKILQEETELQTIAPSYKYRRSQEEMALRVGQSFKNNIHSMIQAPTGTGKTLGHLLPSVLFALDSKEKVLVATGTKTLQHQALEKDIPQLRRMLGLGEGRLKIKALMGSNNHYCELAFREKEKEIKIDESQELLNDKKWAELYFDLIFYHNSRLGPGSSPVTRESASNVLKFKLPYIKELDQELAVDFRSCLGSRCPFAGDCTYINGLKEAREAHVIVGNHALMFSWPKGIPRPNYIVVDEAHKIENEATRALALEVTQLDLDQFYKSMQNAQGVGSLYYLLAQHEFNPGESTAVIKNLQNEIKIFMQMFSDNLQGLAELFEIYFMKRPRYTSQYWNEAPILAGHLPSQDTQAQSIYNRLSGIANIINQIEKLLEPHHGRFFEMKISEEKALIAWSRFESFYAQMNDLLLALTSCLNQKDNEALSWRYHQEEGWSLLAAPIDIGKVLHQSLLEQAASVVMTSATLGNADGLFGTKGVEWSTGYIYARPEKRFKKGLFLPPLYNYRENARVFLCDDVPKAQDFQFIQKIIPAIAKLSKEIGGRSLYLFSSKARFEEAREHLIKIFDGHLPLFIQGMGSKVVEEFKRSGQGVLIGMESFGEGIDIPGDALQFVFIDKIPDLRQDWVIEKRREFYEKNFGQEFTDYYLSHRTRSLHQKIGRLLRTESDRGAVLIVDARVTSWKKPTMEKFERLMLPYEVQKRSLNDACEEAKEFILSGPLISNSTISHLPSEETYSIGL